MLFRSQAGAPEPGPVHAAGAGRRVPLVRLAWGRSGDKGNSCNIAVIARRPEYLPLLEAALPPARVRDWLAHLLAGPVTRYAVPGLHALNFLLDAALDGGAPSSLRLDPMGKGMAQQLLEIEIAVPDDFVL